MSEDERGLAALEDAVVAALRRVMSERGIGVADYRFLEIGRAGTYSWVADGEQKDPPHTSAMRDLDRALRAHRREGSGGCRWYVATLTGRGTDVAVEFDYERPPPAWDVEFRVVGAYLSELELLPRPPSVVPGWMKVELAQVGAWDLVVDEPRWNQDFEPTGVPQSPGSVGVAPPEGAEWAIEQPLPHEDLDAMNRLAIRYAEEEERRTGVFPPELVAFRETWA